MSNQGPSHGVARGLEFGLFRTRLTACQFGMQSSHFFLPDFFAMELARPMRSNRSPSNKPYRRAAQKPPNQSQQGWLFHRKIQNTPSKNNPCPKSRLGNLRRAALRRLIGYQRGVLQVEETNCLRAGRGASASSRAFLLLRLRVSRLTPKIT
jgi:hypothetical protein